MKKRTIFYLAFVLVLALAGCGEKALDLSAAARIEVTAAESDETVILTDQEDIAHICENLHSLKLKKMEHNEPTIPLCTLDFYTSAGEKIKHIGISTDPWLSYDGYFHSIEAGALDLDYIDALFKADTVGDVSDIAEPSLTLATLTDLVQRKGKDLTWSDFDPYYSEVTGSGLYILRYPVSEDYYLLIGGGSMDDAPMYIHLVSAKDAADYIDIRTGSVEDFVSR